MPSFRLTLAAHPKMATRRLDRSMMSDKAKSAATEYARLFALTGGRPPYADCQLVALMIARATNSDIIKGSVVLSGGDRLWHYWAEDIDGTRYDPLAADWDEAPMAYDRQGVVSESSILRELEHFL